MRARIEANPSLRRTYRVGVAVLGGIVLVAGIAMIPYPGPGWLVVFAGLAILATEYVWAQRLLKIAKEKAAQARDVVLRKKQEEQEEDPAS